MQNISLPIMLGPTFEVTNELYREDAVSHKACVSYDTLLQVPVTS